MGLLSNILHGSHFHVVLSLKLQSENAGTCMFILCLFTEVFVKYLFIGQFSKFKVLQIEK